MTATKVDKYVEDQVLKDFRMRSLNVILRSTGCQVKGSGLGRGQVRVRPHC